MRRNMTRGLMGLAILVMGLLSLPQFLPTAYSQAFYESIAWRTTGKLLLSATAPTVSSGFGTSPSIASNNGAASFRIDVGTGGSASTGVIGLPTATTGWNCIAAPVTAISDTVNYAQETNQTSSSTTTATLTNYRSSDGAQTAWVSGTILLVTCSAY